MKQLLPLLVLVQVSAGSALLGSGFGNVQVILGDPAPFPEKCAPDDPAWLHRIGANENLLVAERTGGLWRPGPGYRGRVSEESRSFRFSRTVYTDTGMYELTCGGLTTGVHLNVVFGMNLSVSEGGPLRLDCHYITKGSHVDSVRWEKDRKVLLERDLSSGKTKGSEPRASFPPGGDRDGDWSLLLDAVRLQDEGDYFCSVRSRGVRQAWGEPAAVRLRVLKRDPDQDQDQRTPPSLWTTTQNVTEEERGAYSNYEAITACVVFIIVAPSFLLLGWWLKSRSCCSELYRPVAQGETNGDHQQTNGDHQQANGDHQQANGDHQKASGDHQQANGDLQQTNGDLQQANGDLQQTNRPNHEDVRIDIL